MDISALEKMLSRGQDSSMLRLTLGNAYHRQGESAAAIEHLREAVRLDPDYSAAWKTLGRCLNDTGQRDEALDAYRRGLEAAERRGDMQVVRELKVFIRRLEKQGG
jgi:Tfp pilus assembly protein PilF